MRHDLTRLFIGGEWTAPHSTTSVTLVDPATEELLGQAPAAGPADVDAAVGAARRAFRSGEWPGTAPEGRADLLERFADALDKRGAEIAALCTAENGMPIGFSQRANWHAPVALYRYHAQLARGLQVEEPREAAAGTGGTLVRREPVGVVGSIIPWNYPQGLLAYKLAPALAAGCTVVVKPAPETCLEVGLVADAAREAGVPPGVINFVTGGRETGELLVRHPGVDKISFTGSTAAGRRIAEICGAALKPVTLELGGKSAAIILDDADLATVMRQLAFLSFANSGQSCYANTRVLAPRHLYEPVVDALTSVAAGFVLGDPCDPEITMGPVVTGTQRDRVESYIASGRAEGATVTTGGGRPDGLERGFFVQPTVFRDVDNGMRIAREEIFGPVVSVLPYAGDDEAVAIANDSDYGLAGTVFTDDVDRGAAVARRIETGSIGVNLYTMDMGAPFGGYKQSGLGRELGPEGVDAYLQLKSIYVPTLPAA